MKIEKIMTVEVKFCTENDNLNRAAQLMPENDCGCIPVIAADGEAKLIGLLTDRDICMGSYTQGKPLSEIPVPPRWRVRSSLAAPATTYDGRKPS
jgi:CBS domain-containing protein